MKDYKPLPKKEPKKESGVLIAIMYLVTMASVAALLAIIDHLQLN